MGQNVSGRILFVEGRPHDSLGLSVIRSEAIQRPG